MRGFDDRLNMIGEGEWGVKVLFSWLVDIFLIEIRNFRFSDDEEILKIIIISKLMVIVVFRVYERV